MWNKQRIEEERKLVNDYGLKNHRELWKATSEIRRIRKNVREVLSGSAEDQVGKDVVARLARHNIVADGAILDDLLVITPSAILERRLQTVVYRKGMAKTLSQSRQFIAHGFIAINGRRTKSPGYLVRKSEEAAITYYKPIKMEQPLPTTAATAAGTAPAAAPAAPEEPKGE